MVDDLGQVLNPMIVNGQQHGGVAQGIGQALYEHAVYDRSTAQLVTGSFMDYAMPRADMLPNFEIALEEVPCKTNPIGVKGIGESGTIGAPPVVINAIIDALASARHRPHRYAGDAEPRVASDQQGERREGERVARRAVSSEKLWLAGRRQLGMHVVLGAVGSAEPKHAASVARDQGRNQRRRHVEESNLVMLAEFPVTLATTPGALAN